MLDRFVPRRAGAALAVACAALAVVPPMPYSRRKRA